MDTGYNVPVHTYFTGRGTMKTFMYLLFAAALILGAGIPVLAAGAGEHAVKGEVVAIDPEGKVVVILTKTGEKTVVIETGTQGMENIKPGMSVEMTCIDLEGKSCAKIIKPAEPMPSRIMEGEVVSMDPLGKAVIIRTTKGEEVSMEVTTPRAVVVTPAPGAASTEEMLTTTTMPVTEMKPGSQVKVDCFDMEGKFCANKITVISPEEAGKPVAGEVVSGEVVSIDPAGKSVVIDTEKGKKSLYYQKTTAGKPLSEMEVGTKVRAYCIDVEGKSCIRDIMEVK